MYQFFYIFGVGMFLLAIAFAVGAAAWYVSEWLIRKYEEGKARKKRKASQSVRMPVRFDKKV